MKKISFLLLLVLFSNVIFARVFTIDDIRHPARHFIQLRHSSSDLRYIRPLQDTEGRLFGFLAEVSPRGFLIVAATDALAPVYAYGFEDDFVSAAPETDLLTSIICRDIENRVRFRETASLGYKQRIAREWDLFLQGGSPDYPLPDQWPPSGTTPTGGWLYTNWTQSSPYNNMCPMDLPAGTRSVAGCPAIAMAQILNYHSEINGTRFDDSDDYHHLYGTGNNYWIDDDFSTRDFPSFPTLNLYLDTLETAFMDQPVSLSNSLKAALCFACGVACTQVYSASVSGTYGLEQAIAAFQRFGFQESHLVYPTDTTLNTQIAENVKAELPVHLGLICSDYSCGHNVVVDGYSSDEFYHFNFGWGGPSNGWYTLPPTSIAYNLTIIEGAILDIKSPQYTVLPDPLSRPSHPVKLCPNPWKKSLTASGLTGTATISFYNLLGELKCAVTVTGSSPQVENVDLPDGYYFYRIQCADGAIVAGKIFRIN